LQVFAVCTDNENKMIKMKELIRKEFSDILTYGCNAHYLNLVEKETSNHTILKHVMEVQKYFRNVHQPHVCKLYLYIIMTDQKHHNFLIMIL